ncbi:LAMI_0H19152g1_1 [Lachancea mirantina]|uniref:LAMI_0H19152g1_1 n=1 Tax=Lachancea mirantina TaxID=1230905 RepID=A0A1G4KJS9_9SACH|nr:LAMI_0H19152g1_1 [Lachancea mirantina]
MLVSPTPFSSKKLSPWLAGRAAREMGKKVSRRTNGDKKKNHYHDGSKEKNFFRFPPTLTPLHTRASYPRSGVIVYVSRSIIVGYFRISEHWKLGGPRSVNKGQWVMNGPEFCNSRQAAISTRINNKAWCVVRNFRSRQHHYPPKVLHSLVGRVLIVLKGKGKLFKRFDSILRDP